jgi:hypothetical protein
MKIYRECVPCLGRLVDQISEHLGKDPQMREALIAHGQGILQKAFRPDKCSAWLTTRILEEVSALTGESDPYRTVKEKEMAVAQEIFKKIRPNYGDDFRSCVELAVLGNNIDFFRDIGELEVNLASRGDGALTFAIDHIERVEGKLNSLKRGTVIFLADNAGEVFFDMPLVERIASLGFRTVYGVKDRPFINDLTWADLERMDMLSHIQRIRSTGTGAMLDLSSLSPAFRAELQGCDLIISKGQANYECLSELPMERDIFYLLRAKCEPMSKELHVPLNSYVALLAELSRPSDSVRYDEPEDRPA